MDSSTPISGRGVPSIPDSSTKEPQEPKLPSTPAIKQIAESNLPTNPPAESIVKPEAKQIKSYIETKTLRKVTGIAEGNVFELESQRLGSSSNPVALIRQEYFLPVRLIEDQFQDLTPLPSQAMDKLHHLRRYFDKDQVINNLYILLSQSSGNEQKEKNLIRLIQYYNKRMEPYIPVEFDENTVKAFATIGINPQEFTRGIDPLIKMNEAKSISGISQVIDEAIQRDLTRPVHQRLLKAPPVGVVYKGGQENIREMLATKKAQAEGYADVIHVKEKFEADEITLVMEEQPLTHPIKSDFLTGYHHIREEDWKKWGEARKNYDLELFQKGEVSEETLRKYNEAANTIRNYGADPVSVCKLAFYETKINANDFHTEQFMIGPDPKHPERKQMVSVDEGRWGPPDIAYKAGISSVAITLKNSLLTHPDCLGPVPEEFRPFLEKRLQEIEQTRNELSKPESEWSETLKERVWPAATFDQFVVGMQDLSEDLDKIGSRTADAPFIDQMLKKYQIPHKEKGTLEETRDTVELFLKAEKGRRKEAAFQKQSEQSLRQELEREQAMAEFLLQNPKASIYDAFEIAYPELKTVMKAFRRTDVDPGKNLAYRAMGGFDFLMPRELDKLIEQVPASSEEKGKMREDVKLLKDKHMISTEALVLTHNANG